MLHGNFQTFTIPGKQHLTIIVVKTPDIAWNDARRCIRQIGSRRVIRLIPTTRCALRKWLEVGPRTLIIAIRNPVDPKIVIQALDSIKHGPTSNVAPGFVCQSITPEPVMMPARA